MNGYKRLLGIGLLTATAAIGAQVTTAPAPTTKAETAAPAPTSTATTTGTTPAPAVAATGPLLSRGAPIPAAELEAFVDGYVRRGMAADHAAGVTVGIVQNDQPIFLKGYGISGLNPVRPVDPRRTLFRIGSVSKTMTWILILREVEKGRLKLTDPVNQHLPPDLQVPDQGFKNPIRIVDLMAHAPGFEDSALGHLFVDKPDRLLPAAEYLRKHRPDRVREPGMISSYSNYGVALAGEILARLNGTDFETLADREIFAPLKMTHSTFREPYEPRKGLPAPMPKSLVGDISSGFKWSGGRFQPTNYDYIGQVAAAGSISTTAEDMTRYMRLRLRNGSLEGATLYGPQSAQLFRTPILKVPEGVNGWAHGLSVSKLPGGFTAYGHGGGTTSFFTSMVLVPELDLGIFISTNTQGAGSVTGPFAGALVDRFYAGAPPVQRAGDRGLVAKAGDYAGNYVTTRRNYSGLEKFTGLQRGVTSVSVTPDGYLVTAGGGEPQSWVPTGKPGQFQAVEGDDLLNFVLDKNGRANFIYQNASGLDRVGPLMSPSLFQTIGYLALVTAFGLWVAFLARRGATSPVAAQRRSQFALLGGAAFWLVSIGSFSLWLTSLPGLNAMSAFPPAWLVTASFSALVATIATIAALALMVAGVRQAPAPGQKGGWTVWGMVRHGLAIALFLLLALLVGIRGGLLPWA